MQAVTGRVIAGRYELLSRVGQGATGTVWRASDPVLDREVAVKEIRLPALVPEHERRVLRQRTMREARVAAKLSHPNVVTVYDVVEAGGSPWIVMEYVPARSLQRVLDEDGPLCAAQVASIGMMLLDALAGAHAVGVVHRDVKPANVLITCDERAVLTDFGIATLEGEPGLTQAGMVMGTPGFCAPERIRGEPASPASDLWSAGATLYAAIQGHAPFQSQDSPMAVLAMIVNSDPPPATAAGLLSPVISALMSRDPRARPGTGAASRMLAQASRALAGDRAAPGSRDAPEAAPAPAGRCAPGTSAAAAEPAPGAAPDACQSGAAAAADVPWTWPPRAASPPPGVSPPPGGRGRSEPATAGSLAHTMPFPATRPAPAQAGPGPASGSGAGPAAGLTGGSGAAKRAGRPLFILGGIAVLALALVTLALIAHAARAARARAAARSGRSGAAAVLPAGYRWYTAPTAAPLGRLSMAVPQGWAVTQRGPRAIVSDRAAGSAIIVAPAPAGAAGPLRLVLLLSSQARDGVFPGYHRVAFGTLPYHGALVRALRFGYRLPGPGTMEGLAVVVGPPRGATGAGCEFVAVAPPAGWPPAHAALVEALRTFGAQT